MAAAPKRQARKPATKRAAPAVVKATAPKPEAAPEPSKAALGENELSGLYAEAFEAYDMADERVRFDTLGRRWQFRPDQQGVHSTLSLELKRLEDVRCDHISTHILASDLGKPMIEDVVRQLDKALA